MKTQVCFTVDIEFDIAGTFSDPVRHQPVAEQSVLCDIEGKSYGLGFLLETFKQYDVSATFFLESLNTLYFGDGPMGEIARRISQAGHDIQLHLHPCWTYFRQPQWRDLLRRYPPNDSMIGRTQQEIEDLIETGMQAFSRWALPRPVAVRAGGLLADHTVYAAMANRGLLVASNIGLAIYRPAHSGLHFYIGRHRIHGVTEIPVLTYSRINVAGHSYEKTLTVTGTSWKETESLLWMAHRHGIGPVVILTHTHEYVKFGNGERPDTMRPNRVNRERLTALCDFLVRHRDVFEVVTFAGCAEEWMAEEDTGNPRFSVSLMDASRGLIENKLNDVIPWY